VPSARSTRLATQRRDDTDSVSALAEVMLAEARRLVAGGWCQGTSARDPRGAPILPWDEDAHEWSVMGALTNAWRRIRRVEGPLAADRLGMAAFRCAGTALSDAVAFAPQSWNDARGRTQAEAVFALDEAVRIVARESSRSHTEGHAAR
jgi:hypothetical protein